jgi:nucleoside-diphosphate-sugar epimerase
VMRLAVSPVPLPFGAFKNRRSLLAIDNLVHAVIFCLENPNTLNRTFIVCDREPITLAEMLATLREAAGLPPNLISIPPLAVKAMIIASGRKSLWDRIGRELVASSANLVKAGWSPPIETKAGLRAMMRANMTLHRSK